MEIHLIFSVLTLLLCLKSINGWSELVRSDEATKDVTAKDLNAQSCRAKDGSAKFCLPSFSELVFSHTPIVTSTCGESGPEKYCLQTSSQSSGTPGYCDYCDGTDESRRHPAQWLTDQNYNWRPTHWQSETLAKHPSVGSQFQVNITLDLKIQSQVTYIWLRFQSPRPYSMKVLRKPQENSTEWEPWAYFSKDCKNFYKMEPNAPLTPENRTAPVCQSKYSELVPLSGANVAVPIITQRYELSPYKSFWKDDNLTNWVLATKVRIVLDKLNTHGNRFIKDSLNQYFYAIKDISIGGRCHCHGHASHCEETAEMIKVCTCEHHTMGRQCEMCSDGYRDRPWRAATQSNAWPCKPCNCSGNSEQCEFDAKLYAESGNVSGGKCANCRGNTQGDHCESCLVNHRRTAPGSQQCVPCHCHPIGSVQMQCNSTGACQCKPLVDGDKCDRCKSGSYNLTASGCQSCGCKQEGTIGNDGSCSPATGKCQCKANVRGKQCNTCRTGFYGLLSDDPDGCQRCFCYRHSDRCDLLTGMVNSELSENLKGNSTEGFGLLALSNKTNSALFKLPASKIASAWPVTNLDASKVKGIAGYDSANAVYFTLPQRLLGNQSLSYNRYLRFTINLTDLASDKGGRGDVQLVSGSHIFSASYRIDQLQRGTNELAFRLSHDPASSVWRPLSYSQSQFRTALANVTELRLRADFTTASGSRFYAKLFNVKLETAVAASGGDAAAAAAIAATNVHKCQCPSNYTGNFCERCARGYTREVPNSGPYGKCVACRCNAHADICDSETGTCVGKELIKNDINGSAMIICQHNTVGKHCERCADGYYGNATDGTPEACKKCPCPANGKCFWDSAQSQVVCSECPTGLTGLRCDSCALGFFGKAPNCVSCSCNGNSDPNDFQACNRTTGACNKCVGNTAGDKCEICKNGFYGNALAPGGPQCKSCGCYPLGTEADETCNHITGECKCRPNVSGKKCEKCFHGFFNISSGEGCEPCACNYTGTNNRVSCDADTGKCSCQPGITGRTCDSCSKGYFGFSSRGCRPCNCSAVGTEPEFQNDCDNDGKCKCRENVVGVKCNRCMENRYNLSSGCVECPNCYGAVQKLVGELRIKLSGISNLFNQSANIDQDDVIQRIARAKQTADDLLNNLNKSLGNSLNGTNLRVLEQTSRKINSTFSNMEQLDQNLTQIENFIDSTFPPLNQSLKTLIEVIQQDQMKLEKKINDSDKLKTNSESLLNSVANVNQKLQRKINKIENAYSSLDTKRDSITKSINEMNERANRMKNSAELAKQNVDGMQSQLQRLLNDIASLEKEAAEAKKLVDEAAEKVKQQHDSLLALTTSLSIQTPGIQSLNGSFVSLQQRANEINEKYTELRQKLTNESETLKSAMAAVKKLLDEQQNIHISNSNAYTNLQRQLAQIQGVINRSRQDYTAGNQLLADLRDYGRSINQSKVEAQAALGKLDAIRASLNRTDASNNATRQRLQQQENALGNADKDLAAAQSNASQLLNKADELITGNQRNLREVTNSYNDVEEVYRSLELLRDRLVQVMSEQNQTDNNLNSLSSLSSKAKIKARNLTQRFERLRNDIKDLGDINGGEAFDQEVKKVNDAIDSLKGSLDSNPVDTDMTTMHQKIVEILIQQDEYKDEIEWLEKEHTRLTDIAEELSKYTETRCYYAMPKSIT